MINSHDKGFPRIYTIHSQKGGVGKTSLALAIAGFAAIHHNKKTLIIDADLTGTSLADVFNVSDLDQYQYINELLLAPDGHLKIPHLWPPQNPPPTSLFHPLRRD